MKFRLLPLFLSLVSSLQAGVRDTPFPQDISIQFAMRPDLEGARCLRMAIDRDGVVYVLTDRGLARLFGNTLALDKSYRPLAGRKPLDITVSQGRLFLLYEDQLLSNRDAGKPFYSFAAGQFNKVAVNRSSVALLAGADQLALATSNGVASLPNPPAGVRQIHAFQDEFYAVSPEGVHRLRDTEFELLRAAPGLTGLGFLGREIFLGTTNGFFSLDYTGGMRPRGGRADAAPPPGAPVVKPLQTNLPWTAITCLAPVPQGLWVGSTRGAFLQTPAGSYRYYASRRWLRDDHVLDIQVAPSSGVYILTQTGLNKIEFRQMTLAAKAAHFDDKIRQRHIRYGFSTELRLTRPGDITSAELTDSDNDGTWSNYYMASQAFRFAATGDPVAMTNAWETFEALERLEQISGIRGFPARSFERFGFKVSDPDRWRTRPDGIWEWKGHTSSDEMAAHMFGCSVLYETAARSDAERSRIAAFVDKILTHIIEHNWYLVDVDGKPTLWGRWNPEYVNWYPPTIVDRRLNSAEIIAALQFGYAITGNELYRNKAYELFDRDGYLTNILSSMREIKRTTGFVFQGNDMGDEWNHSDDLLSFITYWVLHRYAFTDELRNQYTAAIKDHWDIEKVERCPLFNFIYGSTGARDYDSAGALWTLREYPLDQINWDIRNSHRKDIALMPANFRDQQSVELLPPDERRIMRWNGNPFELDGGHGGSSELTGDEYLLPYWMGRYLKLIE